MQQQKPLEGAQLVIMTIALSLATFMQVLDSTIIIKLFLVVNFKL